jgi:hypothetical protein
LKHTHRYPTEYKRSDALRCKALQSALSER